MLAAYSMGSKDAVGFAFLDDVIETWRANPKPILWLSFYWKLGYNTSL